MSALRSRPLFDLPAFAHPAPPRPAPPCPADEAMFRMDSKLASYFATLKEGRGGGGAARAARDELLNFKMRVATLLEAFCKRVRPWATQL